MLRDGTGIVQAVFDKTQLPPDVWEHFKELTLETSVHVSGEVRAEPRAPGGYELGVTRLTIVGPSPIDYPVQPKEHGIDFLLDNRHFWLRSNRVRAIFSIPTRSSDPRFFYERGFRGIEADSHRGDRRAQRIVQTKYFDRHGVPGANGQLWPRAAAAAFGRIYTRPTFRPRNRARRPPNEF